MKSVSIPSTFVSVILLLICLISVNVIFSFIPLRFDLTEDRLYTISEGSKIILQNLEEKVRIKYYFSRNSEELPANFKTYALRVQELLEEFEKISSGKIILEVLDPKPDTEEDSSKWVELNTKFSNISYTIYPFC